jgi:hypothetical protein
MSLRPLTAEGFLIMEVWKEVKDYEGLYQVSNFGRVKSFKHNKDKIMKGNVNSLGYYRVKLSKDLKKKTYNVHVLMAKSFLNHTPNGNKGLVVDHIDNNKLNNNLNNLQLISNRENSSKDKKGGTSKYIGVSWNNREKKWRAQIQIKGKETNLGRFTDELQAAEAYQTALKERT